MLVKDATQIVFSRSAAKGSIMPKQPDQSQGFFFVLYATQHKKSMRSMLQRSQFNKSCITLINNNVLSD